MGFPLSQFGSIMLVNAAARPFQRNSLNGITQVYVGFEFGVVVEAVEL